MFHVENNLFVGRLPDGSVRLMKFNAPQARWPNVGDPIARVMMASEFDITIPGTSWASIVASVSQQGEGDGRYYLALAFHNDVKRVGG